MAGDHISDGLAALVLVWLRNWLSFESTALLTFLIVAAQIFVVWNDHRQTTPPLNSEQAKRWEEIRAKGMGYYLLVPGIIFPLLLMLGIVTLMLLASDGYLIEALPGSIVLVAGVTSFFGFLRVGLWYNNEWRYRRSLKLTPTDPNQLCTVTADCLLELADRAHGINTENPNQQAE